MKGNNLLNNHQCAAYPPDVTTALASVRGFTAKDPRTRYDKLSGVRSAVNLMM